MCSIGNTNGIQFFAFSHPTEILSNNLSWGWLIGVIQNTELSPKRKWIQHLSKVTDTIRYSKKQLSEDSIQQSRPASENYFFFSAETQVPHQIDKISSNSGHYLRRTWISFSNDSSFPSNPHRSIHLMATNFPLSDLSSASTTSEKAPLKDTNSINIIWYIWEYKK